MNNILLVDSDLGFAFWLGHLLDGAGYEALPARSAADALALLATIAIRVDLVILNPYLKGAAEFVITMKRLQKNARFMAVLPEHEAETEGGGHLPGIDAFKHKTCKTDEATQNEWLTFIHGVLSGNAVAH